MRGLAMSDIPIFYAGMLVKILESKKGAKRTTITKGSIGIVKESHEHPIKMSHVKFGDDTIWVTNGLLEKI